jgi:hypothetical protein
MPFQLTVDTYINKMLFEPTSPELQQALQYAGTPEAAAEEARNAAAYRGTIEGQTETTKGKTIQPEAALTSQEITKVLVREQGKAYLEYLRIHDPIKFASLNARGLWGAATVIGESPEELAAMELWQMTLPANRSLMDRATESHLWHELPAEEQLAGAERAARAINIHYHNETIYNPVAGTAADRDIGPRANRDLK